jgi:hypothetical protein
MVSREGKHASRSRNEVFVSRDLGFESWKSRRLLFPINALRISLLFSLF